MIQSAMMFALGIFVSGLLWLALSVVLVRRARRLTERRLLASIATRRGEFETERDELRARHAVEMHRQEREVSRVLDMATAYRLEADVKERDLGSFRAELRVHEEDFQDLQETLAAQRDTFQDLERRHAEAGAALRSTQHALKLESKRRAIAEEALDEATILGDQRRIELSALRAQNEALRTALGERLPFEHGEGGAKIPLPPELPDLPATPEPMHRREPVEAGQAQGASVVPLRVRHVATPEHSAALVADAARDLQRLAGEGSSFATETGVVAELDAHRPHASPSAVTADSAQDVEEKAETRFFEALSEIRALKRASGQAGE